MAEPPSSPPSLDALADSAAAGSPGAEAALFAALRERFISLAKRRLREDDMEDTVQDALAIALAKYRTRPAGTPILPWSLLVLRHTIGNAYQRRARAAAREEPSGSPESEVAPAGEPSGDPLGALEREEMVARLTGALRRLSRANPRCGAIFRHVLERLSRGEDAEPGAWPGPAAAGHGIAGMTTANFYVALHRCRARLRRILDEMDCGDATAGGA